MLLVSNLTRLLRLLDEHVAWGGPPTLSRLILDGDGAEVGLKELNGHPAEALAGFRAPKAWDGVGLVAEGWGVRGDAARPLFEPRAGPADPSLVRPSLHPERFRVRTLSVVLRSGEAADAIREREGELEVMGDSGTGTIAFTLRRVLGLPSGAVAPSPVGLFAVVWLAEILAEIDETGSIEPEAAVALHPAMRMLLADGASSADVNLVEAGAALGRVAGWEFLRLEAAGGRFPYTPVGRRVARWMDAAMFGDHVMGTLPSPADLLAQLRTAAPDLAGDVERTLGLWCL